jgi:predicted amidohydrolase YtcJ
MVEKLQLINAMIMARDGKTRLASIETMNGKIRRVMSQKRTRTVRPNSINAGGNLVLPGFVDCHCHLFALADSERNVILNGSKSIEELQKRIAAFTKSSHPQMDDWLFGRGWDQDRFEEKRMPSKEDLDILDIDRPIVMVRVCGHIAVMNTLALEWFERAGALKEAAGTTVERDSSGNLTGIVKEGALSRCWNALKTDNLGALMQDFLVAQSRALSYGITAVHCILSENWQNELKAVKILDRKNRIVIKTSLLLPVEALGNISKMTRPTRDKFLRGRNAKVIGFKLFADGSLGARTAALSLPYSDDPGNSGILNHKDKVIIDSAKRIKRLRLVLAVHVIGDRAVQQVIDCFRTAGVTKRDRFRIEHVSVLTEATVAKLGVPVLCIQPMFASSDYWVKERIGSDRKERFAYPFKTLFKTSRTIAGSDCPVETFDPLKSIKAACFNPVDPGESLDVFQALALYTTTASRESPLTIGTGRVERGYSCDLIVLNRGRLREIFDSAVTHVLINGELKFVANPPAK